MRRPRSRPTTSGCSMSSSRLPRASSRCRRGSPRRARRTGRAARGSSRSAGSPPSSSSTRPPRSPSSRTRSRRRARTSRRSPGARPGPSSRPASSRSCSRRSRCCCTFRRARAWRSPPRRRCCFSRARSRACNQRRARPQSRSAAPLCPPAPPRGYRPREAHSPCPLCAPPLAPRAGELERAHVPRSHLRALGRLRAAHRAGARRCLRLGQGIILVILRLA